jgi:predicted SAM-dependent methyltransferase
MTGSLKQQLRRVPGVLPLAARWRTLKRGMQLAWWRRPAVARAKVEAYLATHKVRRLQIGSGPHLLPGWLNTDFEPVSAESPFMDATLPFPLPDAAFDHVFSEHMIEHIRFEAGLFMLGECRRVLRPGGRIRLATPDARQLVRLFDAPLDHSQQRYLDFAVTTYWTGPKVVDPCYVLNQFMRSWGHEFVYDPPTLRHALERSGFTDVTECAVGESADDALRGLESHGRQIGDEWNRFETMVLEARRP